MIRAMYTAASGMSAQQTRIDVIANNLANVNTSGFKRGRAEFEDMLYQVEQTPGAQSADGTSTPSGVKVGTGVRTVAVRGVNEQGTLEQTSNELDIAIEGSGYLQVLLPNGTTAYTRSGALSVNASGQLVTQNGYVVQPPITLTVDGSVTNRTISADGTVSERIAGQPAVANAGQLQLASFPNDAGLLNIGKNLYIETDASGPATVGTPGTAGFGTIQQGFLESSNVSIAEELVSMITAQRAFELNSRVIRTGDEMLQSTTNIR